MSRRKVLVTGATGFIGRRVVEALLHKDVDIVATSRQIMCPAEWECKGRLQWVPLDLQDLNDRTDYFAFFGSPDVMIHLAWEGLPNFSSDFHINDNLPRHYFFLTNMIANGLKDLTVIGTCLEYGLREGMLSEDMTPLPVVSYAISKNRLREQLESFIEKYLVHFRWLRLFYMYGEGQHPNSLYPQLLKAIKEGATEFNMSGGEQERDFLPVAKVAENIVACALQAKVLGVINVCSGRPLKVKDFVQAIIKGEGSSLKMNLGFYPYSEYEPMCFWGCNSLMKLILITYGSN